MLTEDEQRKQMIKRQKKSAQDPTGANSRAKISEYFNNPREDLRLMNIKAARAKEDPTGMNSKVKYFPFANTKRKRKK